MNEMEPKLAETGNPAPIPTTSGGELNAARVFAALGNPERWRMVRLLADGQARRVAEVAQAVERRFNGVSKHVQILCRAGVLECYSTVRWDGRVKAYRIPPAFRATPGVLDVGCCTVRL